MHGDSGAVKLRTCQLKNPCLTGKEDHESCCAFHKECRLSLSWKERKLSKADTEASNLAEIDFYKILEITLPHIWLCLSWASNNWRIVLCDHVRLWVGRFLCWISFWVGLVNHSSAWEAPYFLKLLFFWFVLLGVGRFSEGKTQSCYVVQASFEPTTVPPQPPICWYSHVPPCLAWNSFSLGNWVRTTVLPSWYSHAMQGRFSGREGSLCALESSWDLLCNW